MELREGQEGQEDATKEKRSDAPDPPPYDPAFTRHVQTLTMKEQEEMLDKFMGIGEDFRLHPKLRPRGGWEKSIVQLYFGRINRMIVPFVSKHCEIWPIRKHC